MQSVYSRGAGKVMSKAGYLWHCIGLYRNTLAKLLTKKELGKRRGYVLTFAKRCWLGLLRVSVKELRPISK
jgi:hypothetical protein